MFLATGACGQVATPMDVSTNDAVTGVDTIDVREAGDTCFPPCLEDLFAQCPPTAPCSYHAGAEPQSANYCYASGARSHAVQTASGAQGTVWRSDGSVCYSMDPQPADGGGVVVRILDGQGSLVAEIAQDLQVDFNHLTVTCGPTTTVVDRTRAACRDHYYAAVGPCMPGTCRAP